MRSSLACLALALSSLHGPLFASDGRAAPAAAAAVPAAAAPASGAASAAKPARTGFQDPMDRLRERLAEKLGNGGAVDVSTPNVVRVVNRSTGATSVHLAAVALVAATSRDAAEPRAAHAAQAAHPAHWDYQGAGGPEHWAQLKPEFATCGSGTRQSPIDIRDGIKVQLDPVQFDYRASSFRVIDNGHTVQVDVGAGNAIEVLGRRYELLQFHFHRPSEERIDGRPSAMVAHLVHKAADGRLAVVAVLIEPGRAHPVVQAVWNNLPLDKGEDVAARRPIDLNGLLPEDRAYFTYMGSLTTPPCTEGVLWMVLRQPVQLSPEQIAIFARMYPMNARPVQQASGRLIKESD